MFHYIKAPKKSNETQKVVLSGVEYLLTFTWNARTGRWWFRLADADNTTIVYRPACEGFPLLLEVSAEVTPPGWAFTVTDLTGVGNEPGLLDFDQWAIIYDDTEANF